jgi:hypothetical protein
MNDEEQKNQAFKRQKLLESMYSKEDLKKIGEFNPKLAKSSLCSAQLRESIIEPLKSNGKKPLYNTVGYIYILKYSFIPGLVKIDYSDTDPIKRSLELSGFVGMSDQFEVIFSCRILNAVVIEKKLHSELSMYRRNNELFELDADLAKFKVKDLLTSWGLIG